jgi:hypothetical protein
MVETAVVPRRTVRRIGARGAAAAILWWRSTVPQTRVELQLTEVEKETRARVVALR